MRDARRNSGSIPYHSRGSGPHALLFVHGFMDGAAVWDGVTVALPDRWQKVTIDLPGMGALADRDATDLDSYGADVADVIRNLGKPVVLVAQSMGAQVAELAAAAVPDRVSGLVLLTPVPLGGVHAPAAMVAQFKGLAGQPEVQRQARQSLSHALSAAGEALLGGLGDRVRPEIAARLVDLWNTGVAQGNRPSGFSGPVMIVRGEDDAFVTAAMADGIAERFASPRREVVAQAGHWAHVEQPAQVAALIADFLGGVAWPQSAARAADWQNAFSRRSAEAFAEALSEDVVLEASVLFEPVRGRGNVTRVMEAASRIYEGLSFTRQAADGDRQYVEWTATAFGGVTLDGVTAISRDASGRIVRIAIHHRPLRAALAFSQALGARLAGTLDATHFLAAADLPQINRS